jgi:hypothetical protein
MVGKNNKRPTWFYNIQFKIKWCAKITKGPPGSIISNSILKWWTKITRGPPGYKLSIHYSIMIYV